MAMNAELTLKLSQKILFSFIFWFMVATTVLLPLFALAPEDSLSALFLQTAA